MFLFPIITYWETTCLAHSILELSQPMDWDLNMLCKHRKYRNGRTITPKKPSSPLDNRKTITSGQFGRTNVYLKSIPKPLVNESTSSSRDYPQYRSDNGLEQTLESAKMLCSIYVHADTRYRYKTDYNLSFTVNAHAVKLSAETNFVYGTSFFYTLNR